MLVDSVATCFYYTRGVKRGMVEGVGLEWRIGIMSLMGPWSATAVSSRTAEGRLDDNLDLGMPNAKT
jgi:hypothetical protein